MPQGNCVIVFKISTEKLIVYAWGRILQYSPMDVFIRMGLLCYTSTAAHQVLPHFHFFVKSNSNIILPECVLYLQSVKRKNTKQICLRFI
jgi:hypothetical protein